MTFPDPTPTPWRKLRLGLALLLAVLTMGLFAPTTGYDFVNYDDYDYVVRNKVVQQGLSQAGLELAMRGGHSTNWHPLTTLSHLLDVELFGIEERSSAGAHHRTNVILHGLNAALCFLALFALTRRMLLALLVAAMFAWHPLRVESVAWISERKDLLSGSFFFLTLWAYARYARHGGKRAYLLVGLCLALGLMSKQMLVSVPFLLVLLDLWPLKRWSGAEAAEGGKSLAGLLLEKLPLIALSLLSIVPMWMAQSGGGTMGNLSLAMRLENALASCYRYIAQTLWPTDLAPFYPHPGLVQGDRFQDLHLPAILGAVLLVGLSGLALKRLSRSPLLAVGWFWYLGMLVPVIGIVQVGSQSHADRYTYLPSIGLYILIAAALAELVKQRPKWERPMLGFSLLLVSLCFILSSLQMPVWTNSKTLNQHALRVTENNYVAHNNYGLYFLEAGADPITAQVHFKKALEQRGNFVQAAENLAASYVQMQRPKDAIQVYEGILRQLPDNARVLARLSRLKEAKGDTEAAFDMLKRATELDPNSAPSWVELGLLHLNREEGIYAEQCAAKAIALEPNNAKAHILHSRAARMLGYADAAVTRIQAAVDADPKSSEARLTQCRILADQGRLLEAEKVCEALLAMDEHNVQARILSAKFLMLRHKAQELQSQATGEQPVDEEAYLERAKSQLQAALDDSPENPEALEFYGLLLMEDQLLDQAEAQFKLALELRPDFHSTLLNLGSLYENQGREAEALEQYRRIMETAKDSPNARVAARAMAWILATSPNVALHDAGEALRMGNFALRSYRELNLNEPQTFEAIAAAFARNERWDDAVKHQEAAVQLAQNEAQRKGYKHRLELYKSKQPYQRAAN